MHARELVEAQVYPSEEDAIQDAFRHLLRARPEIRTRLAIHRYRTEGLSLAKAAQVAGVSWAQMREILVEKGIEPELGVNTLDEARAEAESLQRLGDAE